MPAGETRIALFLAVSGLGFKDPTLKNVGITSTVKTGLSVNVPLFFETVNTNPEDGQGAPLSGNGLDKVTIPEWPWAGQEDLQYLSDHRQGEEEEHGASHCAEDDLVARVPPQYGELVHEYHEHSLHHRELKIRRNQQDLVWKESCAPGETMKNTKWKSLLHVS